MSFCWRRSKDARAREWYVRQTVEHGWSRNVLALHIDAQDYERKGHAVTNLERTLPDAPGLWKWAPDRAICPSSSAFPHDRILDLPCTGDGRGTGVSPNVGGAPCAAIPPIRKESSAVSSRRFPQQCMKRAVANTPRRSPNPVRLPHSVPNPAHLRPTVVRCCREGGWNRELGIARNRSPSTRDLPRPDPQSDMAQGVLKDPYLFGFLRIADETRERELEQASLPTIDQRERNDP